MPLKVERFCAAFAFSGCGTRIAAASVAGAMDDDFSSDAFIKIYDASMSDLSTDRMPLLAQAPIPDRAHRIDWSPCGGGAGMIAAGLTDGTVILWSADKLIECGVQGARSAEIGEEESERHPAVLYEAKLHQLAVKGCQFNPQQPQFLATGGADKELFVWNVQDPSNPLRVPSIPNSTQQAEVTDLCWNPRYAHILGVTLSNGSVVVWDLKSKRPASTFNVSHNGSASCTTLAWHPEIATHLVVARDDPIPAIQVWDLRKATAPIREITHHTGGVLSMAWSSFDPNILASCGRDGRTIFCNPHTGASVGELPKQENWVFEVQWAPRAPAILASSSYDSHFAISSTHTAVASADAPKWLRKPAPAAFGYGGRVAAVQDNGALKVSSRTATEFTVSRSENDFVTNLTNTAGDIGKRLEWLASPSCSEIAVGGVVAAAQCTAQQSRAPMLTHLGFPTDQSEAFEIDGKTAMEVDDEIAKRVAAGRFSDAVTLCIARSQFDEAFAIAHIAGKDQVNRVHEAFVAAKTEKRAVRYVQVLSRGDIDTLGPDVAAGTLPWREALALAASSAPQGDYERICTAFGSSLAANGQLDAALECFICGGAVDSAADIVVRTAGNESCGKTIQRVSLIEATLGREARSVCYAAVLAKHADSLAFEGNFTGAMQHASRAATLGVSEAGAVADRMRFLVPPSQRSAVASPFSIAQLPEPCTPECHMLTGSQPQASTRQPLGHTSTSQVTAYAQQPTPAAHGQPAVHAQQPTHSQSPTHLVHSQPTNRGHVPTPSAAQTTRSMIGNGASHADPTPTAKPSSTEIPASEFDLVNRLSAAAGAVSEKRKRETVEKAIGELARRLEANTLSPGAISKLQDFANKIGTSESRSSWKKLNDEHFEEVKPFLSIKFL